ncbi:uncharacterized protein F5147DRAFT_748208 [Suillus discolor]|uniref:Uncharacterized protein n=1 Tax=Suillus discolor TaxID=1912936 RepID=A0A9P7EVF5_9AGAM|nr:uncharacterized protein F5147DRAFT_748208 [Suillus discolor]KAG2090778.1 hypothetical protein F5147DRAFT_748208 [Suillus discolor]
MSATARLTERNTSQLTIYQYMDKILDIMLFRRRKDRAATKPSTNFSVFHDNLIARLKALSQIQLDFEKRVKDAEGKFTEKLGEMRKQLDVRWNQIDKFESSVKVYGEAKATWRLRRKGRLRELTSQLVTSRRPTQGDSQETKMLLSRAVNAEKRLVTTPADQKWETRVKEYETRLKAGEEKYKRERQGAKERVLELENQMRSLERQNELAQKRSAQLDNVAEADKGPSRPR